MSRIPHFEPVAELPPSGNTGGSGVKRGVSNIALVEVIRATHPDTWCWVDHPARPLSVAAALRALGAEAAVRQGALYVRVPAGDGGGA